VSCGGGSDGFWGVPAAGNVTPPPSGVLAPAFFTGIGTLPGDLSSEATAVSEDGMVVVGFSKAGSGRIQATQWSLANGMQALGFLDAGTYSRARAVSANGGVIVGDGDARTGTSMVFRWTESDGVVAVPGLPNSSLCAAGGVSADGTVIVGTCLITGNAGFRWTEVEGPVSLGQYGGGSDRTSNATAISGDASTIVGSGHPVLNGAMLWDRAGQATFLGKPLGDVSAAATCVSKDGGVVAGYSTQADSHERAFRWTAQTGMVALRDASSDFTDFVATAMSGDGQVIVGWGDTPDGEVAFIWDAAHGMRRLGDALAADRNQQLPGWKLSRATGISGDGNTIVGFGTNSASEVEGWLLRLPTTLESQ